MEICKKPGRARVRRNACTTRTLILREAERSFIEIGYTQTTFAHIAHVLDMSPANVFKHFHSKAELAHAVLAGRFQSKDRLEGSSPGERLRNLLLAILTDLIKFSRDEPRLFAVVATILSAEDADEMLRGRMCSKIREAITGTPCPLGTQVLSTTLTDIFLCVLHPAIISTTSEEKLYARANNLVAFIEVVLASEEMPTRH